MLSDLYLFAIVVLAAVVCIGFNIVIVLRLREFHGGVFENLDRPSSVYFFGIQWMLKPRFFNWLWSGNYRSLADKKLANEILGLRAAWIAFHICFVLFVFKLLIK